MSDGTARFALPFILPGQAQKELFHNEALALLDGLVQAAVEEEPIAEPPANPLPGQCWIAAAAASGAWTGSDHALAVWTQSGWRFAAPVPGMLVWNRAAGLWLHWTGASWSDGRLPAAAIFVGGQKVVGERQPTVPSPSGGTTIDAEGRTAIDAVIVALRSHGLIE